MIKGTIWMINYMFSAVQNVNRLKGCVLQKDSKIRAKPILGGLYHHYFQEAAWRF
jgi:hypothetical protein